MYLICIYECNTYFTKEDSVNTEICKTLTTKEIDAINSGAVKMINMLEIEQMTSIDDSASEKYGEEIRVLKILLNPLGE